MFFLVLIFVIIFLIRQQSKHWRVKRWQKSLQLSQHAANFHALYATMNGFSLSREARKRQDTLDYIYGEIEFTSFIALMSLVRPNSTTIFYDLGSGIGTAVLACAMVYPVKKSIGVELLPALHHGANYQKAQLATLRGYKKVAEKINFIRGDFLSVNFDDATLVFVNSTTLFGKTWEQLSKRLEMSPQLLTVITTSKPLNSCEFTITNQTKVQMSWGIVDAYIHVRKQFFTNQIENIE